jgi:hypothetical protein
VARRISVKAAMPNVICVISSEQEIPLSEANLITVKFIEKIKGKYGENPADSPNAFYFNLFVDQQGQIISALPALKEIGKAKRFWPNTFTNLLQPPS